MTLAIQMTDQPAEPRPDAAGKDAFDSNGPMASVEMPAAVRRHRRGAGFGIALLVVLLGVIILSTRGGPSSASAAILHSSAGDDEAGEIIAARTPVIREVDDAMAVEAGVIGRLDFQPDKIQIPLMQLKINPFRRASAATTPAAQLDDAAEAQRLEQARRSALAAVQSLQLGGIRAAAAPRECTINGMRYQEGQEVGGFLVEEIASNTVVVRQGIYRFELKPTN